MRRVIIDGIDDFTRLCAFDLRKAWVEVSRIGQVRRGLAIDLGTEAHLAGNHVTSDGPTTQHQGFQCLQGHCIPPAVLKNRNELPRHRGQLVTK